MPSLTELIAAPGFAPKDWQTPSPLTPNWGKPAVEYSDELRRIVALPRRPMPHSAKAEALIALANERFGIKRTSRCSCRELGRECITTLRLAQAWGLFEIGTRAGLLGPVGVGHGKTMLDLLAPLAMPRCRLALLLVPPTLVDQLVNEYRLVGQHFRVPSLVVHGRPVSVVVEGAPVLHVLPYSRLSRAEASAFLERLGPDTVIADEAHKLRYPQTATTSRVLRYFDAHPDTRFCGWSGSLTDSSIRDYAHLAKLALRHRSPLPTKPEVVDEWAGALDPGDRSAPAGALLTLCQPGEHVYDGFHRRLVETPGVVSTTEPAVDAELRILERSAPPLPPAVEEALGNLRGAWMRPDGEELVDALSVARCACELAAGFYYRWTFPRGESVALILEWLAARKEWHKELREKLKERREHLDSPLLCARAAARAWGDELPDATNEEEESILSQEDGLGKKLPRWKAETWPRWRAARGTVQPVTEAVRLDPYLARDAAEWAATHRGIIWYEHRAFGEWVAELSGLPMHGGGPGAGERIAVERGDRSIIASIKSHGTGRDGLQRLFKTQLVSNPPSSATAWEQLLGRLLRVGQEAPVVEAWMYQHTPELKAHFDQALSRAVYVQSTIGSAQKILSAKR